MNNSIKKEILKNKKNYDKFKKNSLREKNLDSKLEKIRLCGAWAVNFHTGLFSDEEIEKSLIDISQSIPSNTVEYKKGTVLHVMTKVSEYGGHTRYINNWLKSSQQINSICFTEYKKDQLPSFLSETLNENTISTYFLKGKSLMLKASHLREIASKYEYIVLSTGPNDILPILAFGHKSFQRPIIFLNHADHLYWLGFSVADMIVELSNDGVQFTKKHRGNIDTSYVLPIPIHPCIKKTDEHFLDKLGIDKNDKIVVSMASSHKYNNSADEHFSKLCQSIVEENLNTYCIIIGPSPDELIWKKIYQKTAGHVIAVGILRKEEVQSIIKYTNLYIDSFPYRSYTSFLEFAVCGVPSITLKNNRATIDVLKLENVSFETKETLLQYANTVLQKNTHNQNLFEYVQNNHLIGHGWNRKLNDIFAKMDKVHKVNFRFAKKTIINDNDYVICKAQKKDFFLFSSLVPLNTVKAQFLLKAILLKPSIIFLLITAIRKLIKKKLTRFN